MTKRLALFDGFKKKANIYRSREGDQNMTLVITVWINAEYSGHVNMTGIVKCSPDSPNIAIDNHSFRCQIISFCQVRSSHK